MKRGKYTIACFWFRLSHVGIKMPVNFKELYSSLVKEDHITNTQACTKVFGERGYRFGTEYAFVCLKGNL